MWADNILLANGREVLTGPSVEPRWSNDALGTTGPGFARVGDTSDPISGIFKIWSTPFASPMLFPENVDATFDFSRYPLIEAVRVSQEVFNPATDAPTLNCARKGMPTIMEQPFPMQFVQQAETILLRLEEYDTVRTIHMGATSGGAEPAPSPLGHSKGRWEGDTLVVTTTHVNWPHFDTVGIPLSQAVEIVERFTPSEDGSRLDYRMTVTDPEVFTAPVVLEKFWLSLPGIELKPYECTP